MPHNPHIKNVTVRIGTINLRRQLDKLVQLAELLKDTEELDGLINMLDEMLDMAEGYPKPTD